MDTKDNYLIRKTPGLIYAMWARDSETGDEYLMDLESHKPIAKRVNGMIVDPATNLPKGE